MLALNVPITNGQLPTWRSSDRHNYTNPEKATNRCRGWLKTSHPLYESLMWAYARLRFSMFADTARVTNVRIIIMSNYFDHLLLFLFFQLLLCTADWTLQQWGATSDNGLDCDACCLYRLYGVESEFLSPTAIKARLPLLRTEDLLVGNWLINLVTKMLVTIFCTRNE